MADVNFSRAFSLPGIGELQAHSLGVSSVFDANTPASYINSVMRTLGAFYQDPSNRRTQPDIIEVYGQEEGMGEASRLPGAPPTNRPRYPVSQYPQNNPYQIGSIIGTPGINPAAQDPRIPMPPAGQGVIGQPGNTNPGGADNSVFSKLSLNPIEALRQWAKETDAGTRMTLVLLALVLLAVGIISLR